VEVSRDIDVRRSQARDASGLEMVPDAVARATTIEEVVEAMREAAGSGTPVTAAGSQTSTTGASITDRGILLSLRGLDRILDIDPVARVARVQPGVTVAALDAAVAPLGLLFAPDPTSEHDATIGGAVACNASGARSLRYGATRRHVRALRVVGADGSLASHHRMMLEKNTVGYAAVQDPVDWFVGSEGTLGIVVEAEMALVPRPASIVGLAIPFATQDAALAFVVAAREMSDDPAAHIRAQCLEFFDDQALAIARRELDDPRWMSGAQALMYVEQAFATTEVDTDALERWLALAAEHGANEGDVIAYADEAALRAARRFRHAIPSYMIEHGNARRPFGGRRVSTDWAVPFRRLADALDHSRRAAAQADCPQAVTYGHVGNGHPHQNFIAHDADELRRLNDVVTETIRHVLQLGGTVAAEHGLGKLKRHWLERQLTAAQVGMMRAIKQSLDPAGLLAPGNVL
jgi:glycolate oxidase